EDDIQRMVREAEQYAEEDRKKKEKAEARNQADTLLYSVDKTLKDLGEDKVTASEREAIDKAKEELRRAMEGDDVEEIKKKTEALSKALYDVTTRIYQQAGAQQASGQAGGGSQA